MAGLRSLSPTDWHVRTLRAEWKKKMSFAFKPHMKKRWAAVVLLLSHWLSFMVLQQKSNWSGKTNSAFTAITNG